jgi:hypothetical protein
MYAVNLHESFRWLDRVDGITRLVAAVSMEDGGVAPEIKFAQPTLDTESVWMHIERYANQTFEDLDVPVRAVRGEAHWEQSGIAIVVSQAPLLQYLRDRQVPWGWYERDLARLILIVLGRYHGDEGLATAAQKIDLELAWPPVAIPVPTAEVDAGYEAGIRMGTESRITVLMKKDGLTRAQAEERAREIDDDSEAFKTPAQEQQDVLMQQAQEFGEAQGEGQAQGQGQAEGKVTPGEEP